MLKIPYTWTLPKSIENRLGQKSFGKQRAMVAEGHLLLVLHRAPKTSDRQREGVLFWRNPNGSWKCSLGGVGLDPINRHLKEYQIAEEKLGALYQSAETARDLFEIIEQMAPLQVATRNLHAALQSAREGIPNDQDIIDLRDWAYEIDRTLDLTYLTAKNALDFKIAKKSEEQANLSYRLNILAAIFFPLTAIACAFGMNLPSGFEKSSPLLFWIVLGAGIYLGFVVRHWVLTGVVSNETFIKIVEWFKNGGFRAQ